MFASDSALPGTDAASSHSSGRPGDGSGGVVVLNVLAHGGLSVSSSFRLGKVFNTQSSQRRDLGSAGFVAPACASHLWPCTLGRPAVAEHRCR